MLISRVLFIDIKYHVEYYTSSIDLGLPTFIIISHFCDYDALPKKGLNPTKQSAKLNPAQCWPSYDDVAFVTVCNFWVATKMNMLQKIGNRS